MDNVTWRSEYKGTFVRCWLIKAWTILEVPVNNIKGICNAGQ